MIIVKYNCPNSDVISNLYGTKYTGVASLKIGGRFQNKLIVQNTYR